MSGRSVVQTRRNRCRPPAGLLVLTAMNRMTSFLVRRHGRNLFAGLAALLCFVAASAPVAQNIYDRAFSLRQRMDNLVDRAEIKPHWLADNHRFWYRVQTGANTHEFILVDAATGTRQPAFDHAKLAAALRQATSQRCDPTICR